MLGILEEAICSKASLIQSIYSAKRIPVNIAFDLITVQSKQAAALPLNPYLFPSGVSLFLLTHCLTCSAPLSSSELVCQPSLPHSYLSNDWVAGF